MNLTWPSAAVRWRLDGPASAPTDTLVAALIDAGLKVEGITPGTAYRVDGDAVRTQAIAEQLAELEDPDTVLRPEPLPSGGAVVLRTRAAPAHSYRRSVWLHGAGEAFRYVARAVDAELQVEAAGNCRFRVTGRTATLLAWASAHVHRVPVDEVLALWALSAEDAREEDAGLTITPVVVVKLPDRVTESKTIERNADGDIVRVIQVTTDAP